MTPQERQLVAELFDRLATLEGEKRDPDAERAIDEGLSQAPHAAYALVQTVLVQDEALKRADARIRELEANLGAEPPRASGGFLDNMRDNLFGQRPEARGSVPTVRPGGAPVGAPLGYRADTPQPPAGGPFAQDQGRGGGSFLGTAAAAAAGVIGGSLLLGGIRSMFGDQHGGAHAQSAFDPGLSGETHSPWGADASGSDLARQAGLNDMGGSSRSAAVADDNQRTAGLFDSSDDVNDDGAFDDDTDVGDSDIDTA